MLSGNDNHNLADLSRPAGSNSIYWFDLEKDNKRFRGVDTMWPYMPVSYFWYP